MDVFANRDVCNLIMVDFATNKPILNFPYANTTTTSVTGESVFAYGGQGHPRRVTFYAKRVVRLLSKPRCRALNFTAL